MTSRFELQDYEDREKIIDAPMVVIMDAGYDYNMVRIKIGDDNIGYKIVKVLGEELIKAAKSCMHLNCPF